MGDTVDGRVHFTVARIKVLLNMRKRDASGNETAEYLFGDERDCKLNCVTGNQALY